MRSAGRVAMLAGALLVPLVLLGVTAIELRPYRIDEVALVRLSELPDRTPVLLQSQQLDGLEYRAALIRNLSAPAPLMHRGGHGDLPVFLVRDGASVRGFIAVDPLTGCRLEPWSGRPDGAVFHDRCWGSLYTQSGRVTGGPSPWTLDELVLRQADGIVYASALRVHPGEYLAR